MASAGITTYGGHVAQVSEVAAHLPPGPRWPLLPQLAYLTVGQRVMNRLYDRHGTAFSMRLPFFGPAVVISDPVLVKEFFKLSTEEVGATDLNLGRVLGAGSSFALAGEQHLRRRKLVLPHFHGERMRAYDELIVAETRSETANWPDGVEFSVSESMMRITLNTILRGVFGAEGRELEALKVAVPKFIKIGAMVVLVPALHCDLGRWSPWNRLLRIRKELDGIFTSLIRRALDDPSLDQRPDILALLLQARYDDGTAMSHSDVGDELLALMVAGHETTATALAWTIERLRRHPEVLDRLYDELDAGGTALMQATVHEVLRNRPIIDAVARQVIAPSVALGPWVVPRGHVITANIALAHRNETVYADAHVFDPDRFAGSNPGMYSWIPFGGGVRRCPGAAFANMEMVTVLRTILTEFVVVPTTEPDEARKARGTVFAPAEGGRVVVRRKPGERSINTPDRFS